MPYSRTGQVMHSLANIGVNAHSEQILDSSVRIVIARTQGAHDLIPRIAHLNHVVDGCLEGFAAQK